MIYKKLISIIAISIFTANVPLFAQEAEKFKPITIAEQGSFAAGGSIIQNDGVFNPYNPVIPTGQSYHGDHAYAFYQKPLDAKNNSIIMLHGAGQFSKTWETTPDGREGFQTIFLRRGFTTYLIDQPRRGNAGRSISPITIEPKPDEQMWFNLFRLGHWPHYHDDVQFSKDPETLNQYFRQMTPNTGEFDVNIIANGVAAVADKAGSSILFTHSQGGGVGWHAAIKSPQIKAIVTFEPGSNFVFPEGELPQPIDSAFDTIEGEAINRDDFMKLTKLPILIIFGDYIPSKPSEIPLEDAWRARLDMIKIWRDTVNKYGGDVTLIVLPEIGIKGNTHFPFSDKNNVEIADIVSKFLKDKKLD